MNQEKINNKIEWLQILRGLATVFVVFGHIVLLHYKSEAVNLISSIVYLFHMPLFFAMSGFLFGYKEISHSTSFLIKKKLITLGIPYFVFSALYIVLKLLLQNVLSVESEVSWIDLPRLLFFPSDGDSVNWYWFLYALIFFFIIFAFVKDSKIGIVIISIISLTVFFIWRGNFFMVYNGCFQRAVGYIFVFALSILLGKIYAQGYVINKRFYFISGFFALLFCILAPLFLITIEPTSNQSISLNYLCIFLRLILIFAGVTFSLVLSFGIGKTRFLRKLIIIVSEFSWYIYLLHSYALNLTRNLLVKLFDLPVSVYVILNLVFGICIPIFIALIIRKIKFIDFFFYPGKYINIKERNTDK